jgi:hypothetical protein
MIAWFLGRRFNGSMAELSDTIALRATVVGDNGYPDDRAKFKVAWARIRAGRTDEEIAMILRYAEASRKALARYVEKYRK